LFYRETGQFKISYVADMAIFPIRQDKIALWMMLAVAFIGVPLYMVAQNRFSEIDPVYWYFWIGLLLIAVVVVLPNGLLGGLSLLTRRAKAQS